MNALDMEKVEEDIDLVLDDGNYIRLQPDEALRTQCRMQISPDSGIGHARFALEVLSTVASVTVGNRQNDRQARQEAR